MCAVYSEVNHRTSAQVGTSGADRTAPIVVCEFLLFGDVGVRTIEAHRYGAVHFVRSANERQAITAVQVTIVFKMSIATMRNHFHGIGAVRGNEYSRFAIRIWQMREYHGTALGAAGIRPVSQGFLQRAAQFRLVWPVGTPRHHRLLQSPQCQMAKHVLSIFL